MKVYCVYGYPPVEGACCTCVDKIFSTEKAALDYMKKINKEEGWTRMTCVDEVEVED